MKNANTDKKSEDIRVNDVKIKFTDKPITSWGGLATLLGKFLEVIKFQDWVEQNVPINENSNNSIAIYDKVVSQFITNLSGGSRFSHLQLWTHGSDAIKKIFKLDKIPKASTTLTRFWGKISTFKLSEQLLTSCRDYALLISLKWAKIKKSNLNFDSSVLIRYGQQDGAKRGYNPSKKGRPSHNPIIAFLGGSGYTVNIWNRSGDVSSGNGIVEFFKQTVHGLGSDFEIDRVLCDSGFYLINFITHLENNSYKYIIAAPISEILQKAIMRLQNWEQVDNGIEIAEFEFQHQDKKWTKNRRYVVVRQETSQRPKATGKQPSLFKELDELKPYRFSLYITNEDQADLSAQDVWREYRPRANDENCIKDLKEGCNLHKFCLQNFWATSAILTMITLVFYNLINYFNSNYINPEKPKEQIKTLRLKYFIIAGQLGSESRYSILRLGITCKKTRIRFRDILKELKNFPKNVNCNAVEIIPGST